MGGIILNNCPNKDLSDRFEHFFGQQIKTQAAFRRL